MTDRRKLYAMGEPFGDCATQAKPGGGRVYGGGGDSSSSSSNQTTTNNVDRRQVVDTGSVGISSDASTVNIQQLDQGAIAGAREIAVNAIANNATNTAKLLDTAAALFQSQQQAIGVSATLANSLAAKASGTADNGLQTEDVQKNKNAIMAAAALAGLAGLAYLSKK